MSAPLFTLPSGSLLDVPSGQLPELSLLLMTLFAHLVFTRVSPTLGIPVSFTFMALHPRPGSRTLVERSQLKTSVKNVPLPHILVPRLNVYVHPIALGPINYKSKCSMLWTAVHTSRMELWLIGTCLRLALRGV